jgi:outer membrane protein OmpA-like peptidoglycan-associated protein
MAGCIRTALFITVCAWCWVSAGCATKKYVRESIAPVQGQANQTQEHTNAIKKQTDSNREAIGDLDRNVATTSEKATEAEKRAAEALEAAARATAAAAEAARRAEAANAAAVRVDQDLQRSLENMNNFRQVATEQIFFGVNRTVLKKEESDKLDAIIQKLNELKAYIVEVEGFADSTGDPDSNLKLSQQRADAVVHYLAVEHNVSVGAIRQLGVGSDFPGADNKTSAARKSNRRVDIKVYTRDLGTQGSNGLRSAQ